MYLRPRGWGGIIAAMTTQSTETIKKVCGQFRNNASTHEIATTTGLSINVVEAVIRRYYNRNTANPSTKRHTWTEEEENTLFSIYKEHELLEHTSKQKFFWLFISSKFVAAGGPQLSAGAVNRKVRRLQKLDEESARDEDALFDVGVRKPSIAGFLQSLFG